MIFNHSEKPMQQIELYISNGVKTAILWTSIMTENIEQGRDSSRVLEKESWSKVEKDIESIGEYYDSAASIISFGMMDRWRKKAALETTDEMTVLEVGSGPGSFTRLLHGRRIVMLEPNEVMLRKSIEGGLKDERYAPVIGVAEHLPFVEGAFDRVMSGFSFKNFIDKGSALKEIRRVLEEEGWVVIIDIAEPDTGLRRSFMRFYMKHILGRLAFLVVPRKVRKGWTSNPWQHLSEEYMNLGKPDELAKNMMDIGYSSSGYRYLFTHGVAIVTGRK